MRNKVAKQIRKAVRAAMEETNSQWMPGYKENENLRNPESSIKYIKNAQLTPEKVKEVLESGWHVTGPWMYKESCGKDLYKIMKQNYKKVNPFFEKSSRASMKMLMQHSIKMA